MPKKLEECVKKVMEQGKSKESAYAICTAQFKDKMFFSDKIGISEKGLISVRDGYQEYAGIELGAEPYDKTFKIFRSAETIKAILDKLDKIPVTDEHVELEDIPKEKIVGYIEASKIVDFIDDTTDSTIAIENVVKLDDNMLQLLNSKNQLSLGYFADMKEHSLYDFEQVDIIPHHLAIVKNGRCGDVCKFKDERNKMPKEIEEERKKAPTPAENAKDEGEKGTQKPDDKKADEEKDSKKEVKDGEENNGVSLQRVAEAVKDLPEAVKLMDLKELEALIPTLEKAVSVARAKTPAGQEAKDTEKDKKEMKDSSFKDSQEFKDAVIAFADERVSIVLKAKNFLDSNYDFSKDNATIMRDALATQTSEAFKDEELSVAFKMLKKIEDYSKFADAKTDEFEKLKDKEI